MDEIVGMQRLEKAAAKLHTDVFGVCVQACSDVPKTWRGVTTRDCFIALQHGAMPQVVRDKCDEVLGMDE